MKKNFNEQIIYQIMPDRFFIGSSQTAQDKLENGLYPENADLKNWTDKLDKRREINNNFYGGDLDGIIEKLDYIKNVGANVIYLTPIFQAETYHKYDAINYKTIDKSFGGDKGFNRLLAKLKEKDMKLIIDIAFNHVSYKHPYFQDAVSNPDSKYRDFFNFIKYPEIYSCWWGHDYLPELNLNNPEVIEEFITGENSVIKFWLEKGVDGIRLDCANDLGVSVNKIIKETVNKINPDAILIGEVFNFAPDFTDGLDSLQSYMYTQSIFSLLNNKISAFQFGQNLQKMIDNYSHSEMLNNLIILSSHDSPRALTQLFNNVKKLFLAITMQFTLPGVPKVYYGEEVGMKGGADPLNRAPMIWNEKNWNKKINQFYKKIVQLRKNRRELVSGKILNLTGLLDNGIVAYLRYDQNKPDNYSVIVINPTGKKKKFRLFIPYSYFFSDMLMIDQLTGRKVRSNVSDLDLELGAYESSVYIPDYLFKKNYNYYKRVNPVKEIR